MRHLWLSFAIMHACSTEPGKGDDSAPPDTWEPPAEEAADTVVIITMDSVNARVMLAEEWPWEVSPNLDAFYEESVLFENVLSPRGVTQPALTTMLTGLYPVHHGIRANEEDSEDPFAERFTSLLRQFQEAGYRSYGFSANQCQLISAYVDERMCTWEGEAGGEETVAERDEQLVDGLVATLADTPEDEKLFLWLHLNNPHKPWNADHDAFVEFHPEIYEGLLRPGSEDSLDEVTQGYLDYSEEDRLYVEASYASQLRATDAQIARVFDALKALERWDDAVVVVGVDHGEELAAHADYFWHGCSPYTAVLRVVYAFKSPLLPAGSRIADWVSAADVAPTVTDLASAFPWGGELDGRSLLQPILEEDMGDVPVFFERSVETAGMIREGYKIVVSGEEGYDACSPYNELPELAFPGELLELYDLEADPHEQVNLVESEPELAADYQRQVCEWVVGTDWTGSDYDTRTFLQPACETLIAAGR